MIRRLTPAAIGAALLFLSGCSALGPLALIAAQAAAPILINAAAAEIKEMVAPPSAGVPAPVVPVAATPLRAPRDDVPLLEPDDLP